MILILITSVMTRHPVSCLEVWNFSSDEIGEDSNSLVVVELLEDLLVSEKDKNSWKYFDINNK